MPPEIVPTRRNILRTGLILGTAGALTDIRALLAAEDTPVRSHGPWELFKDNPRQFIRDRLTARPTGSKISDEIFYSSALENVIYLDLGPHAVLIDTGFDHQADHHLDVLREMGCDLKKIVCILATHSHVDHTGGIRRAQQRLQVPVVAHRLAIGPIGRGDLLQTAAVIPEVDGWEFEFPPCDIDHTVDDRDVIEVGAERIRVLHIPGHTPDSVGYLWRDHFFSGDAVFGLGLIGWANARWLSNYADHAQTMQSLIDMPVPAQSLYAAHGPRVAYSSDVPRACLKTLGGLLKIEQDPCNHTDRVHRRAADAPVQTLHLK